MIFRTFNVSQTHIPQLMSKTKSELYKMVSDLITKDKFEEEIKKRSNEYEGLLSDEAIAYIIVDELGKDLVESVTISELKNKDNVSLTVKVEDFKEPREFKRKNGSIGQVVNLVVSDGTGKCNLTLWDKDVEVVKNDKIKKGSELRIVNGYVKVTDFGLEINIGKWGAFFINGK